MKREVVQDFLNLPGITGIALMDGRSRPFFCGVDQSLNFQQKEALAQGIQQVVETTPAGFEFYEFHFAGHQVYIHRLEHGIILLVVGGNELARPDYEHAIGRLKTELNQDAGNAIADFRLLAGNLTLSNANYWKQSSTPQSAGAVGNAYRPTEPTPEPSNSSSNNTAQPSSSNGAAASSSAPTPGSTSNAPSKQEEPVTLKELLDALNHFSQFTTQYLGATVVTNYWKTTRPKVDWLDRFQVNRSAQILLAEADLPQSSQRLSSEEHEWLQAWSGAFIERCSKVIRDFPSIIEQRALDERQKHLLLPKQSN